MSHKSNFIFFIFVAHLFCLNCVAQVESGKFAELFDAVREDEKLVVQCEQKRREYQLSEFGRILPKISGHCWDGCPTNIVLPRYPNEAKRLKLSGKVIVETIVNEDGEVIYARTPNGQSIFSKAAEQAAYRSRYQPKKTCDNKAIKFRWTISYNFILK